MNKRASYAKSLTYQIFFNVATRPCSSENSNVIHFLPFVTDIVNASAGQDVNYFD